VTFSPAEFRISSVGPPVVGLGGVMGKGKDKKAWIKIGPNRYNLMVPPSKKIPKRRRKDARDIDGKQFERENERHRR